MRSTIDNRNPGYQPVHRHVAIFHDREYMAAIKAISKGGSNRGHWSRVKININRW